MALASAIALLLALFSAAKNETGLFAPAPAPVMQPTPAPAPAPAAPVEPPAWQLPVLYAPSNRGLQPQRLLAYNKTHYYQLLPAEQCKGLVVMFHGCARLARAFFPYDPERCPECLGEPGELRPVGGRAWREPGRRWSQPAAVQLKQQRLQAPAGALL